MTSSDHTLTSVDYKNEGLTSGDSKTARKKGAEAPESQSCHSAISAWYSSAYWPLRDEKATVRRKTPTTNRDTHRQRKDTIGHLQREIRPYQDRERTDRTAGGTGTPKGPRRHPGRRTGQAQTRHEAGPETRRRRAQTGHRHENTAAPPTRKPRDRTSPEPTGAYSAPISDTVSQGKPASGLAGRFLGLAGVRPGF